MRKEFHLEKTKGGEGRKGEKRRGAARRGEGGETRLYSRKALSSFLNIFSSFECNVSLLYKNISAINIYKHFSINVKHLNIKNCHMVTLLHQNGCQKI